MRTGKKHDLRFYLVGFLAMGIVILLALLPDHLKYGNPVIGHPGAIYPTVVREKPEGFVSLEEIEEEYGDIIHYWDFEHKLFCIEDLDGVEIARAVYDDESFVVKYAGELYVNQDVADQIIAQAPVIAEQRNRVYQIGEQIPFEGARRGSFAITLENAVYHDTVAEYTVSDGNRALVIEFSLEGSGDTENVADYFGSVETSNGDAYYDFTALTDTSVVIQVPKAETVKYISVISPSWFYCVRTVAVE